MAWIKVKTLVRLTNTSMHLDSFSRNTFMPSFIAAPASWLDPSTAPTRKGQPLLVLPSEGS